MKLLPLPAIDYLAQCFDFRDGALFWKARPVSHFRSPLIAEQWNAKHSGHRAGRKMVEGPYRQIAINSVRYLEHRIVAAMHGLPLAHLIDHKDGDGSNNDPTNLRSATQSQNCKNTLGWGKKQTRVGIHQRKNGKWNAYIRAKGKHLHLGTFATEAEATGVRADAERLYYGEFAAALRGVKVYEDESEPVQEPVG